MRIRKIQVEGDAGKGTVFRSGVSEIVINTDRASWVCSARNEDEQWRYAKRLQVTLDGVRGTNSMIHDYYRIIRWVAED